MGKDAFFGFLGLLYNFPPWETLVPPPLSLGPAEKTGNVRTHSFISSALHWGFLWHHSPLWFPEQTVKNGQFYT